MVNNKKNYLTIDKIIENDVILRKNHGLVPADAVLKKVKAIIEYRFVTCENLALY